MFPIQHCNERILKRMGRSGSTQELVNSVASELRFLVWLFAGMCGFPGETDDNQTGLCDFIQEREFDYTSVFTYSPEGTLGAKI